MMDLYSAIIAVALFLLPKSKATDVARWHFKQSSIHQLPYLVEFAAQHHYEYGPRPSVINESTTIDKPEARGIHGLE